MHFLIDRLADPVAVTLIAFALLAPAPMPSAKAESVKIWPILKEQAFGDRAIRRFASVVASAARSLASSVRSASA